MSSVDSEGLSPQVPRKAVFNKKKCWVTVKLGYNELYVTVGICLLYPWHCYNREGLCCKLDKWDQKYQLIVYVIAVNLLKPWS